MGAFERDQLALAERWSQPNRLAIAALCKEQGIPVASHDDATEAHVDESHAVGSVIAEFPTTLDAAKASRQRAMKILMGAPNIVRGGSHSGNVAAAELAAHGLLDILSSDYYPASQLDATFSIAFAEDNPYDLPAAVALVTRNPAQSIGLQDRGVVAEGKSADLLRKSPSATGACSARLGAGADGLLMARLIWLMGASGAGKDTLLQALRESMPTGLLVAHRYITLAVDAGGENHIALREVEFQRRWEAGLFAVHWQAHHQHYALGIEIDLLLARGLDVLANGSRLHLPALTARYAGRLLPVCLKVSLGAGRASAPAR